MDIKIDPVPTGLSAGIYTVGCECGWEAVFVLPEEQPHYEGAIFRHLAEIHGLELPMLTVTCH
jgi:hypothetical protein